LDDVFEKLDENRMAHLLDQVCSNHFGQVFITDTHADRIKDKLDQTGSPISINPFIKLRLTLGYGRDENWRRTKEFEGDEPFKKGHPSCTN
jgi:hypothetical protein